MNKTKQHDAELFLQIAEATPTVRDRLEKALAQSNLAEVIYIASTEGFYFDAEDIQRELYRLGSEIIRRRQLN